MDNESISQKLSELFELHKSGAISKEEFESLKKHVLSENNAENEEPAKREESEEAKLLDKPVKDKKVGKRWIFIMMGIVLLVATVYILKTNLFKGELHTSEQKIQTIKDIDGNEYQTVTIGTQVWMAENLKTTKFNDGLNIELVTGSTEWATITTPAYCWFNNDISNKNTYGALYNWYAVNTNKLCPAGWHVPTNEEWTILTDYLTNNGYGYDGSGNDIAKSLAATSGWLTDITAGNVGNDQASNNRSSFTALQAGYRINNGSFQCLGSHGKWWSSSESSTTSAYNRFISYNSSEVTSYVNRKRNGFSVRCVRDLNEPEKGVSAEPVLEGTSEQWDENYATTLVIDELKKYTGWKSRYDNRWESIYETDSEKQRDYSKDLEHQLSDFQVIKSSKKKLMSVIAYSKLRENYDLSDVFISVFEFENIRGWRLTKKAIAFASLNSRGKVSWYKISPHNYAISVFNSYFRMGESNAFTDLYTFLNGEISNVLRIEHWGEEEEVFYNLRFRQSDILDNNGYYYLLAEEKFKNEDLDTIVTRKTYAFNGAVYEEFNGTITDPSLTSINRFIDINSIKEKDNNVCPTCHGTGIIICSLCGGSGVNNMGIECLCIRTYKMEIAAGHAPSHEPLRWTCTSCGGTGKLKY
jgi:uncharacterized protein (TIGR02145 family)